MELCQCIQILVVPYSDTHFMYNKYTELTNDEF